MLIILVIVLLLVLLIYGIDMGLQNVAMATQAQATVETARAAQIASVGNVVVIVLVVLLLVALLAAVGYVAWRRSKRPVTQNVMRAAHGIDPVIGPSRIDADLLMKLMMIKMMSDWTETKRSQDAQTKNVDLPREEDPLRWKR